MHSALHGQEQQQKYTSILSGRYKVMPLSSFQAAVSTRSSSHSSLTHLSSLPVL